MGSRYQRDESDLWYELEVRNLFQAVQYAVSIARNQLCLLWNNESSSQFSNASSCSELTCCIQGSASIPPVPSDTELFQIFHYVRH